MGHLSVLALIDSFVYKKKEMIEWIVDPSSHAVRVTSTYVCTHVPKYGYMVYNGCYPLQHLYSQARKHYIVEYGQITDIADILFY